MSVAQIITVKYNANESPLNNRHSGILPCSFSLSDFSVYCKAIFTTSARYTRLKKKSIFVSYFTVGLHVYIYTMYIYMRHWIFQTFIVFAKRLFLSLSLFFYKIYRWFTKRSSNTIAYIWIIDIRNIALVNKYFFFRKGK